MVCLVIAHAIIALAKLLDSVSIDGGDIFILQQQQIYGHQSQDEVCSYVNVTSNISLFYTHGEHNQQVTNNPCLLDDIVKDLIDTTVCAECDVIDIYKWKEQTDFGVLMVVDKRTVSCDDDKLVPSVTFYSSGMNSFERSSPLSLAVESTWFLSYNNISNPSSASLVVSNCPMEELKFDFAGAKASGFSSVALYSSQIQFSLPIMKSVTIDLDLFAGGRKTIDANTQTPASSIDVVPICAKLNTLAHHIDHSNSFLLHSGFELHYQRLPFWFEVCRITPLVVNIQELRAVLPLPSSSVTAATANTADVDDSSPSSVEGDVEVEFDIESEWARSLSASTGFNVHYVYNHTNSLLLDAVELDRARSSFPETKYVDDSHNVRRRSLSYCLVKSIKGENSGFSTYDSSEGTSATSRRNDKKYDDNYSDDDYSFYCLQDVFQRLLRTNTVTAATTSRTTTASTKMRKEIEIETGIETEIETETETKTQTYGRRIPPARQSSTLTFVSSMRFSDSMAKGEEDVEISSIQRQRRLEGRFLEYLELLEVIKAFASSGWESVSVESVTPVAKNQLFESPASTSVQLRITSLLAVKAAANALADIHYDDCLGTCNNSMKIDTNYSSIDVDSAITALLRDADAFVVHGDEGLFGHFRLPPPPPFSDPSSNTVTGGDVRSGDGPLLSCYPLNILVNATCPIDSLVQTDTDTVVVAADRTAGTVGSGTDILSGDALDTKMLITNAVGDAHVLVFIEDSGDINSYEEMLLAEEVLQSWREGCVLHTCQFFSRYNLIPVRSVSLSMSGADGSSGSERIRTDAGYSDDLSIDPSTDVYPLLSHYELNQAPNIPLHTVIAEIHQYIRDMMGQFDTIAVLIGIEALLAFEQPGKDTNEADYRPPFIPNSPYGASVTYPMHTPLVFGLRPVPTACISGLLIERMVESIRLSAEGTTEGGAKRRVNDRNMPGITDLYALNPFAFGGTGLAVSKLISKVRRSGSLFPRHANTVLMENSSNSNIGSNNSSGDNNNGGYNAVTLRQTNLQLLQRLKLTAIQYAIRQYASLDTRSQFFRFGYSRVNASHSEEWGERSNNNREEHRKLSLTYMKSTCIATVQDSSNGANTNGSNNNSNSNSSNHVLLGLKYFPSNENYKCSRRMMDGSMGASTSSPNPASARTAARNCFLSNHHVCDFRLFPQIQRPRSDIGEDEEGTDSPTNDFSSSHAAVASTLSNAPPLEYGSELPELFSFPSPSPLFRLTATRRPPTAADGSFNINYDVIQKSYEETIGYCNAHQWTAATIRTLYTLDTLLKGLPLTEDQEDRKDQESFEESIGTGVRGKDSSILFRANREKGNAEALRLAFVPIYNLFQGAPNMRKSAGRNSLAELRLVRDLLQHYIDNVGSNIEVGEDSGVEVKLNSSIRSKGGEGMAVGGGGRGITPSGIDIIALYVALASAQSELGNMAAARSAYVRSVIPTLYQVVRNDRVKWRRDRTQLSSCSKGDDCPISMATLVIDDDDDNETMTISPKVDVSGTITASAKPSGGSSGIHGSSTSPASHVEYVKQQTFVTNSRPIQTHYITVASDNNTELQLLEASAAISGISLTVIGLDQNYVHYGNKVQWLLTHINQAMTPDSDPATNRPLPPEIEEDDVIVFMDSYDVLVFPSIRPIGSHFASTSPTPIVFCTEHGLYPEFSSGWNYNKMTRYTENYFDNGSKEGGNDDNDDKNQSHYSGKRSGWRNGRTRSEAEHEIYLEEHFVHDVLDAKQLNSGCYIGRAGEVRDMLHFVVSQSEFYRDDQQMFVRYAQSNPQLVSVDIHRTFFRTAYRQFFDSSNIGFTVDYQILPLHTPFMSLFNDYSTRPAVFTFPSAEQEQEQERRNIAVLRALNALIRQSVTSTLAAHPSHPDYPSVAGIIEEDKIDIDNGGNADVDQVNTAVSRRRRLLPTDVRLLHCNNKGSNSLYASFGTRFIPGVTAYFYAPDPVVDSDVITTITSARTISGTSTAGSTATAVSTSTTYTATQLLLVIMRAIADGSYRQAWRLLHRSKVFRDITCEVPPSVSTNTTTVMTKHFNMLYAVPAKKQEVLVCYYRYKLQVILQHTGLWQSFLVATNNRNSTRGRKSSKISENNGNVSTKPTNNSSVAAIMTVPEAYILRHLHFIIPFNLKMYNNH